MNKKMVIAYAGGFWGTNIGNAFFDLGCLYALKKTCPEAEIIFTLEQPANYWQVNGTNPPNALAYLENIKADFLVVAGPMISMSFPSFWRGAMEKLKRQGTKLVLLSAGCNGYDEGEKAVARAFLKEACLYALISRDEYTYDNYKDLARHSYNGICCALFSNDYFRPYDMSFEPYVVFNFETTYEPVFSPSRGRAGGFEAFGGETNYSLFYGRQNSIGRGSGGVERRSEYSSLSGLAGKLRRGFFDGSRGELGSE